jgi:pimeloyl-ACP methyl ester carboxylesterase
MSCRIAHTAKGPIEYRLEGSGPTVMVLNGGHCSRETRLTHERLQGFGFTVLTPSRPGYDGTPSEVGRSAQDAADALAALLDQLGIDSVDLIGISAAGPTSLAFAARHPHRIRRLILESAVTVPWRKFIRIGTPILFGKTEAFTWSLMRLLLKLSPMAATKLILRELTTLRLADVIKKMGRKELDFVRRMIETSRSGSGFVNDIRHVVGSLASITAPVLVMYSPNDKSVPPQNARRVAAEVAASELYEVPSDTHLIWIGKAARDVWEKRLSFLRSA